MSNARRSYSCAHSPCSLHDRTRVLANCRPPYKPNSGRSQPLPSEWDRLAARVRSPASRVIRANRSAQDGARVANKGCPRQLTSSGPSSSGTIRHQYPSPVRVAQSQPIDLVLPTSDGVGPRTGSWAGALLRFYNDQRGPIKAWLAYHTLAEIYFARW